MIDQVEHVFDRLGGLHAIARFSSMFYLQVSIGAVCAFTMAVMDWAALQYFSGPGCRGPLVSAFHPEACLAYFELRAQRHFEASSIVYGVSAVDANSIADWQGRSVTV